MLLILLSPAKRLNFEKKVNIEKETIPFFLNESQDLINNLLSLNKSDISSLMKLSPSLSELNYNRYKKWDINHNSRNSSPAISCFEGDVYKNINIDCMSSSELNFLQKNVRILSGLYGLLKPFDLIQAYRLEMGTKLITSNGNNLYKFWGNKINKYLKDDLNKNTILINLASNEYYKSINSKNISNKIITPVFLDEKKGKFKVVSFFAKRARGSMVEYIAKNNLDKIEKLRDFTGLGYTFDKSRSTDSEFVYCR